MDIGHKFPCISYKKGKNRSHTPNIIEYGFYTCFFFNINSEYKLYIQKVFKTQVNQSLSSLTIQLQQSPEEIHRLCTPQHVWAGICLCLDLDESLHTM